MDALYSGFSYASNEVRRSAQPVVDVLAPVLPTFGCGEAAVKQSASKLIHELESSTIFNNHVSKTSMGWSSAFSSIKKIVLYPFKDPAGAFSPEDKCRESTQEETSTLGDVTGNINRQLESWGIPFRFEVSNHRKTTSQVLQKESSNCLAQKSKTPTMALHFAHCDDLKSNGHAVGGYQRACHLAFQATEPRRTIAHELAHVFSVHPFDAIPLNELHPDLLGAMCEGGAHGDETITSLSYWNHCRDMGYPDTLAQVRNSRGQWGPIELTLAKLATHKNRDDVHAQIHAEGVDQCYEWIRQNYGERVAEQFVCSFVKSVFVHVMSAAIARSVSDRRVLRIARVAIHMIGNFLHMGMIGKLTEQPWFVMAHMFGSMNLMGRAVRALTDVVGDAAILHAFYHLMRGNSDAMLQMVYATCGTAAGNAFSQLIIGFIASCAPTDASQRNAYIELSKPCALYGVAADEVFQIFQDANRYLTSRQADDTSETRSITEEDKRLELPSVIKNIISIDRAIADVITNYVSLHVLTSWLWKTDQQKAQATVQASVDRLSLTLDEVKSKFGPSNLPRVPANTRSFRPTAAVPPLDLDRETEIDPLLMMDGAAVTGIGNASLPEKQQRLQEKKQQ